MRTRADQNAGLPRRDSRVTGGAAHHRARARRDLLTVLVPLGVLAWPAAAEGAPSHVRLSYTGATDTSMTVSWNTASDVGSTVEYGTTPGSYAESATGSSMLGAGPFGYIHEVTLTGLTPATTYYYRAGDAGDGWAGEYSFTTGPVPEENCADFRFVYFGDNRPQPGLGGGENYDQILSEAFNHGPAFLLNGGDLVADGNDTGQWLDYLGYNDDQVAFVPNMASLGNHDTGPSEGDDAHFNQLFALPRSTGTYGSNTEDYYFFRYGNAIFVALSTETFMQGATPMADQAAWLDEVLTANPARWKFLYYHKPSYTHEVWFSISHEPNEEGQNAALIPIIDKHHVDVVLTSHNHWYERYAPSACATQGDPNSGEPCTVGDPANGTIFFVSGGAGAYTIPGLLCGNPDGREVCSGDHHYMLFNVAGENLTIETWGANPQPNVVIDTVTITKAGVECDTPIPPDGGTGGSGTGGSGTGASSTGGSGTGASSAGGSGNSGAGATGPSATPTSLAQDSDCGCRAPGSTAPASAWLALLGAGALALGKRRRSRARASRRPTHG